MADKIYIVTLKSKDDLEGFYSDMSTDGFKLHTKRPISRNTQYYMTEDQAVTLRSDSRVLACEERYEDQGIYPEPFYTANNEPYDQAGFFRKSGSYLQDDRDWGKLHSAGDDAQRRKNSFGSGEVSDNVTVFNSGRHVDVVVCDDPVAFDCEEWKAPSDMRDRFQQYDWYGELNGYVSSIDDDGQGIPSAPYPNYFTAQTCTAFHGTHVAGTIAGRHYGWAPEANIYSLQVLGNPSNQGTAVSTMLIFDYLRAFHRYKPINPETGKRNPTITNHSWGYGSNLAGIFDSGIDISDVGSVVYRGTTFSSGNPNPSGWTMAGLENDFGISAWKRKFNADYIALKADIEDAIDDGVVVIAAMGNNDFYAAHPEPMHEGHADWNNTVYFNNVGTISFMKGSTPANTKGIIAVGALSTESDFRRATFSNFGPQVTVWAPGVSTVSAWVNPNGIHASTGLQGSGTPDGKYGGTNWYHNISGTSMASPQVAGMAACLATGKERFTNSDVIAFIQQHGKYNDIGFNLGTGNFSDATAQGGNNGLYFDSPNLEIAVKSPRYETGYQGGWYKDQLKGMRRDPQLVNDAQMYPRTNTFYRKPPGPLVKTFPFTVTTGGGDYIMTGDDRQTNFSNNVDPAIVINQGDTVEFSGNMSGHPFWISDRQGTGQPTASEIPQGVTGNGSTSLVSWTTTGVTKATYYYNCEYHSTMSGTITII